jgi:hypothetical protein
VTAGASPMAWTTSCVWGDGLDNLVVAIMSPHRRYQRINGGQNQGEIRPLLWILGSRIANWKPTPQSSRFKPGI